MERGKEFVVPFLVIAVVLTAATVVASWTGFFIALVAVVAGAVIGMYYMAVEVRKVVAETEEEYGEQPFPFL